MSANETQNGDGGVPVSDKFVDATGFYQSDAVESETTKFPWLGPTIFFSVLVAVTVFFVWFLGA